MLSPAARRPASNLDKVAARRPRSRRSLSTRGRMASTKAGTTSTSTRVSRSRRRSCPSAMAVSSKTSSPTRSPHSSRACGLRLVRTSSTDPSGRAPGQGPHTPADRAGAVHALEPVGAERLGHLEAPAQSAGGAGQALQGRLGTPGASPHAQHVPGRAEPPVGCVHVHVHESSGRLGHDPEPGYRLEAATVVLAASQRSTGRRSMASSCHSTSTSVLGVGRRCAHGHRLMLTGANRLPDLFRAVSRGRSGEAVGQPEAAPTSTSQVEFTRQRTSRPRLSTPASTVSQPA